MLVQMEVKTQLSKEIKWRDLEPRPQASLVSQNVGRKNHWGERNTQDGVIKAFGSKYLTRSKPRENEGCWAVRQGGADHQQVWQIQSEQRQWSQDRTPQRIGQGKNGRKKRETATILSRIFVTMEKKQESSWKYIWGVKWNFCWVSLEHICMMEMIQ